MNFGRHKSIWLAECHERGDEWPKFLSLLQWFNELENCLGPIRHELRWNRKSVPCSHHLLPLWALRLRRPLPSRDQRFRRLIPSRTPPLRQAPRFRRTLLSFLPLRLTTCTICCQLHITSPRLRQHVHPRVRLSTSPRPTQHAFHLSRLPTSFARIPLKNTFWKQCLSYIQKRHKNNRCRVASTQSRENLQSRQKREQRSRRSC